MNFKIPLLAGAYQTHVGKHIYIYIYSKRLRGLAKLCIVLEGMYEKNRRFLIKNIASIAVQRVLDFEVKVADCIASLSNVRRA